MNQRILGLINARGGSKGIPRKNIKPLLGKPLIAYAIQSGLDAKKIDKLVVSTEDPEIADIAKYYGACVPFIRPGHLASDVALQIDVIKHALIELQNLGEMFDIVVILQPTCPLRIAADVDGALSLMEKTEADTVISVTQVQGFHPMTMYTQGPGGTLSPLIGSSRAGVLRQQFPIIWWRNGAIYALRTRVILEQGLLYGDQIYGYPMPPERSANIDEPIDWIITEAMLSHYLSSVSL